MDETADLPPGDLSPEALEAWPGLVADLHAVGRGAAVDLELLADVLRARARLAEVSRRLNADGPVVPGSRGQPRGHPLLTVEAALRGQVSRSLDRLGLSPRHRSWAVGVAPDGRLRRTA